MWLLSLAVNLVFKNTVFHKKKEEATDVKKFEMHFCVLCLSNKLYIITPYTAIYCGSYCCRDYTHICCRSTVNIRLLFVCRPFFFPETGSFAPCLQIWLLKAGEITFNWFFSPLVYGEGSAVLANRNAWKVHSKNTTNNHLFSDSKYSANLELRLQKSLG